MVKDLTKGNPFGLILSFSAVLMISSVCQYLYNVVDTMIVGRFISSDALAAVGATGSITFLILGFMNGISSGFGVVIGQIFGAGDMPKLRRCVANIIWTALIVVTVVTTLSCALTRDILTWMNTPADIFEMSYDYLIVMFGGMVFTLFYNTLAAILRALGDTRTPLIVLVVAVCLNVVFDLLFVVVFHWGVAGAAYATLLAQAISAAGCLTYIVKKVPILHFARSEMGFDPSLVRRLLSVGAPMGLQFSITAIGGIILQSAVNRHGTDVVAAITTCDKVSNLFTMFMDAVGATMAFYCAQNRGAGRIDRVRQGVRSGLLYEIGLAVFGALMLYFFGRELCMLFIGDVPAVLAYCDDYMLIKVIFFVALAPIFVLRNSVQGLGYSLPAMLGGVIELFARSLTAIFFAENLLILYMGGPIAWIAATILFFIIYPIVIRRLSRSPDILAVQKTPQKIA